MIKVRIPPRSTIVILNNLRKKIKNEKDSFLKTFTVVTLKRIIFKAPTKRLIFFSFGSRAAKYHNRKTDQINLNFCTASFSPFRKEAVCKEDKWHGTDSSLSLCLSQKLLCARFKKTWSTRNKSPIQTASFASSVTRWLDYTFNIWPVTTISISSKA